MQKNTKNDFFTRIIVKDNGCHEFQSYADRDGYRFFQFEGKEWKAHRLAVVFDGRDPAGKVVMHHCDNPACVNPKHLSVATQQENNLDKILKGRAKGNIWPTRKGLTKEMLLNADTE
jgi:HNH endonuclease